MSVSRIASIAGMLLVSACTAGSGLHLAPPKPAGTPVHLHVINNFGGPLEIFAVGSGTSYRMGTVLPGLEESFVVRESMLGGSPVEFVAQPTTGGQAIRSGRLLLSPGNVVDFTVEAQATLSSATVRP